MKIILHAPRSKRGSNLGRKDQTVFFPILPAWVRSYSIRRCCSLNISRDVSPRRIIRTPACVFGGSTVGPCRGTWLICRLTLTVPFIQSTADQDKPRNSENLMPVVTAKLNKVLNLELLAATRKDVTCCSFSIPSYSGSNTSLDDLRGEGPRAGN